MEAATAISHEFLMRAQCNDGVCSVAWMRKKLAELAISCWFLEFRRVGEAAHPGPEPGSQVFQDWRSANITGFCHAEAALAWNADVLGITELRGSPEDAAKTGKRFGKAVSCSLPDEEGKSLAAIFYCGTKGKATVVPCRPGWGVRLAAIQVQLSKSLICTAMCLYGHSNPTKEMLEDLDQQLLLLLEFHAAQGKGPMIIMGDFNAVEGQLSATVLARRAAWQDLSQEGTCLTATSAAARRLDHVWVSPALAGRSSAAEVSWAEGLPTHAVQSWRVLAEVPGRLDHWQVADPGPEEGEGSFTDQEWKERFEEDGDKWQEMCRNQDVDGMWNMLEESLISCHKIRAPTFQQPRGKVTNKCEEAPQNTFTGCAETEATIAATRRK
jgi:hypothetical protein